MKTREYEMVHFISFCIESYKHFTSKSGKEVVELFSKFGVIDYLLENYEVFHYRDARWLAKEIAEIIKIKREAIHVFHGSAGKVETPRVLPSSRILDYGAGFYTTVSFKQAKQRARREKNKNRTTGYVNIYKVDETSPESKTLNTIHFRKLNAKWVHFVVRNRTNIHYTHNYDIVRGPVANDEVYAALALHEDGVLDTGRLISKLRKCQLVDQIIFYTEKALSTLQFIEAKKI
jgi:hypothetical protein